MSFEDSNRFKTGWLGEQMVDVFLKQQGWVPYYPMKGVAHPFDRLLATPDKRRLCIVEIKTKFKREFYPDTGIERRHFNDYQAITMEYNIPLFLVFVDAKAGQVYGQWWAELLKTREPEQRSRLGGCVSYPWFHGGQVYFQISIMKIFHVIPPEQCEEILKYRESNWQEHDENLTDQIKLPHLGGETA